MQAVPTPAEKKDRPMLDYEICYLTKDDKLALLYRTQLSGDRDAVSAAARPMRIRYKQFEVWRGHGLLESAVPLIHLPV